MNSSIDGDNSESDLIAQMARLHVADDHIFVDTFDEFGLLCCRSRRFPHESTEMKAACTVYGV
jgi:hypothetical protein